MLFGPSPGAAAAVLPVPAPGITPGLNSAENLPFSRYCLLAKCGDGSTHKIRFPYASKSISSRTLFGTFASTRKSCSFLWRTCGGAVSGAWVAPWAGAWAAPWAGVWVAPWVRLLDAIAITSPSLRFLMHTESSAPGGSGRSSSLLHIPPRL